MIVNTNDNETQIYRLFCTCIEILNTATAVIYLCNKFCREMRSLECLNIFCVYFSRKKTRNAINFIFSFAN